MKYLHYFENNEDENFEEYKDDVVKVFENDEWLVIKPNSFEAFCYYGQDQGWSDVDNGRKYNFRENTFINIKKDDNIKVVLNFDRGDFYGEDDDTIYLKEFLDDNSALQKFYGEILHCSDIVEENGEYWLVSDGYVDFFKYFKIDRNTSERFVKGVLEGESYDFFQYDDVFELDEYGLNVKEDTLMLLKVILILEKFHNDEYDYNLNDIKDFDDVVSIIKEYDIESFEDLLKTCLTRAHEYADGDAAFEELTNQIYEFFNLYLGSGSPKWQHYKNSKDQKLWIKFKSKSDANNAKFIINKYDDSYDDEMIDYSSPYYGYHGETKVINDYLDSEIPERTYDYDGGEVTGEEIDKYYNIWKELKEKNPELTDDELYADFDVYLNAKRYNL